MTGTRNLHRDLRALASTTDVTRERVEAVVYAPVSDVLRNHLVTLAYVDLSNKMAEVLGADDANWCTLAVWPSYTVGQTIRAGKVTALKRIAAKGPWPRTARSWLVASAERDRPHPRGTMNRSLAAGNRGVFYEVGLAWTDFLETFGEDPRRPGVEDDFAAFRQRVHRLPAPPGRVWPDGDRDKLAGGFEAYLKALQSDDPTQRSQLILLGNLLIGEHEQRRLQGWLDRSADAPLAGLIRVLSPFWIGRRLVRPVRWLWNRFLTKRVYVVVMGDEQLAVGRPVPPADGRGDPFPAPLDVLTGDVAEVFDGLNEASPGADGADQWSDIDNRMAFIAQLFRARQRAHLVGRNPFSPAEVSLIAEKVRAAGNPSPAARRGQVYADLTKEVPSPWDTEVDDRFEKRLVRARSEGDLRADRAVDEFFANAERELQRTSEQDHGDGAAAPQVDRFYTHVIGAASRIGRSGSGPLAEFLAEEPTLPPWADTELLERAQRFYAQFRSAAHLGLFYGAMPLSYAASDGCQVLGLLSTLNPTPDRATGDTVRRFWESTRFVEDVFTTPFWEADSAGYGSIRGVRLFHAAVRDSIENGSEHILYPPCELESGIWDDAWGRPINQEDMLAGTLDWAVATIGVMTRFGVPYDADDARAYLHAWLVVGALLGVDEDLLTSPADPTRPLDLIEAQRAAWVILDRQLGPTPAGRRLMDGMLALIDEWFPGPTRRLPRAMIYAAVGTETASLLGLPPARRFDRAFMAFTARTQRWRNNRFYAAVARRVIRAVGEAWLRWWEREYTDIPPYRRGGTIAVEKRIPRTLSLWISAHGELEDLPARLGAVDDVDVETYPLAFDGTGPNGEPLPQSTEIVVTSEVATSLREVVRRMRDGLDQISGLESATLTIDGVEVPLRSLSDEQIDELFPS